MECQIIGCHELATKARVISPGFDQLKYPDFKAIALCTKHQNLKIGNRMFPVKPLIGFMKYLTGFYDK